MDKELRRELAAATATPCTVESVLGQQMKAAMEAKPMKASKQRIPSRKIECKRLAGRNHMVGNTVFLFDINGIAEVALNSSPTVTSDIAVFLRQNGVRELLEETPAPNKASAAAAAAGPSPTPTSATPVGVVVDVQPRKKKHRR